MRKRFALLLLVFSMITVSVPRAQADTIDRILVVVNDDIITESDLNNVLGPLAARMRATLEGPQLQAKLREARSGILRRLIDDRLIVSAAKGKNIQVEDEEVDEMVDEMRAKFPSQEAFEQVLREQGISYKEIRERFYNDLLKQRMTDFKVRSRISISPGDIRDYYDKNADEFNALPEAKVRQILIRTGSVRSEDEAKDLIQGIVKRIENGERFEVLAAELSEGTEADKGGDMGWVQRKQFMERIDVAIFKLKTGEYSEPIKTQLGYHLFLVEETRMPEAMDFSEVQNKIEKIIYRNRMNELMNEWLEELRSEAYISFQR